MKEILLNKNIINTFFTISLYLFVIVSSMMPNKYNMKELKQLNTIIPGFNTVSCKDNNQEKKYSFKILEIINNFL